MHVDLKEKIYMIKLFDEYKNLLTTTQVKYLSYYYFDDYSLREISEIYSVSRNAVHDSIAKAEKALKKYEKALGNLKYKNLVSNLLEKIKEEKKLDDIKKIVEKFRFDETQKNDF